MPTRARLLQIPKQSKDPISQLETAAHISGKEDLEISMLHSFLFFCKIVAANCPISASGMLRFSCFENLAYHAELLSLIELPAAS